jgi:hypothetical protein
MEYLGTVSLSTATFGIRYLDERSPIGRIGFDYVAFSFRMHGPFQRYLSVLGNDLDVVGVS